MAPPAQRPPVPRSREAATSRDDADTTASPHVEYDLTDEGRSLAPVLQALYDWGVERAGRTGVTFTPSRD